MSTVVLRFESKTVVVRSGIAVSSGSGTGDVASDPIWDAPGDLALGTGPNTATRLPIGAAGQVPRVAGGTLAYDTLDAGDVGAATPADVTAEAGARATAVTNEANARIAADNLKISIAEKGVAGGVANLDGTAKIPAALLPALAIVEVSVVGSQAAMLALVAQKGDIAVRTDSDQTFILSGADPTLLINWTELLFPGGAGAVVTVNGRTGNVTGLAEQVDLDAEEAARIQADADHVAHADPHTQYQKESEKGAANGYASLDSGGTVPDAQIPTAIARDAEVSSAISTHAGATDPHGDRAYSDGQLSTHAAAADPHTGYQKESEKGAAGGYAQLDGGGVLPDSIIPAAIARDAEVTAAVNAAVAALVNSAPGLLDTLSEIAAALGNDPSFSTTISALIATKVAKSLFDANTVLVANSDDTPAPLTIGEATILGRLVGGNIAALTASQIRTLAGLVIGTDVQAYNANLAAIVALAPANDDVLQRKSGAWANRTMAQLAVDLGIPASLNVLLGSIDIPRRSLDRFRGAPNEIDTTLAADITSTATTITTNNENLARVGTYPVKQIGSEQIQIIRGQGTTTLTVRRHVNGTTAAAHTAGDPIVGDKVRNVVALGDSTCEGTASSLTGEWDAWVSRTRRIFNERFGGSLGSGFFGIWRKPHASNPREEWDLTASNWFSAVQATDAFFCGPWESYYGSVAAAIATWTRPAKTPVAQIDVIYVVWSSGTAGTGGDWSYSTDGGSTWVNNPQAGVDNLPTSTTTLGSADNGRRCDYWDGTKSMAVASTTGMDNAGFVLVDVGSGGTFKCRAAFTYGSVVDATHLGNVQYIGPAAHNALTTVTGDTVQIRPELRKASIVVNDPATFKIRCGNAAGTNKTCMFAGIDVWSSVPTFGVTRGVKVHNLGYGGNTAAVLTGSRTIADVGISGTTITGARLAAASADVGSQIIHPLYPAGTIVTAVAGSGTGTSMTTNNAATGSVTAGLAASPMTIQGMRGGATRFFNGSPCSLLPDLIIYGCWTNDMDVSRAPAGADTSMTGTFVSGSPNVTVTAGNGIEPLDQGRYVAAANTIVPAGTTILTRTDATHFVMSANASSSITAAFTVDADDTTANTAIKNILGVLHAGGIGVGSVTLYADELIVVPFEQGVTRLAALSPTQSTAAYQATYRQALHDWATANLVATLDIYKAWASEGNTGYAAANADGLMDTADVSGFHEGPVGYRDMASRITRLLEFA